MGRVSENAETIKSIRELMGKDVGFTIRGKDLELSIQMDISKSLAMIADDLHQLVKMEARKK